MKDNLRNLFPTISDEAAYHLVDFFYELALMFESSHLQHVMRYEKSLINANHTPEIRDKQSQNRKGELPDPPF
jgi:hypothetical protein